MNKALKYTTALGSATVALAFAVTAASADTSVINSGNNANVNTSTNTTNSVNVSNTNTTEVSQSSVGISNTGGNMTKGNIGGGSVMTGAATTSSNQQVTANQNQTAVALPTISAAGRSAEVVNTGKDLDLDNSTNHSTSVHVLNANQLAASQHSISVANTGLNASKGNIDGGSITTGAAGVSNTFEVEGNWNATTLNLGSLGAMTGGNGLSLTNSGKNANIDNSYNVETVLCVTNMNSAAILQSSFGLANSGLNFTHGNIDGGSIATGAAAVSNTFDVMVNKNTTGIAFGASTSTNDDLEIINTGKDLNVNGSNNVSTVVTATSTNGTATAQTSVDVSNSGLNFGVGNVGGGSLGSGNAGVWTGFMAGGNWNQTMID